MEIIIDLIIVAIILVNVILAYKKGFIASLLSFLGTIISWVAAINLSTLISNWIYSNFIKTPITEYVTMKLTESANTAADTLSSSIPEFISNAAITFGIDLNSIITDNAGKEIQIAASSITSGIIEPVLTVLIRIIAVILLYIVFSFVIKVLVKLFKKINKIPIVGSLNKSLGVIVGLLKGVLIAALICIIFSTIVDLVGGELFTITKDVLNSTYVFRFLNSFNPIV